MLIYTFNQLKFTPQAHYYRKWLGKSRFSSLIRFFLVSYLLYAYMPFLGIVIGFFLFYGWIFCAETVFFVDVPIKGYVRLRNADFGSALSAMISVLERNLQICFTEKIR